MATEKIILAKDELETAKLKLIKAWLKRRFKGKRKMDRQDIWFDFVQFVDQLHDLEFDKIFDNPEYYNFVSKVDNEYENSFALNPNIDKVKILTRTRPSGFFVQRPQYKGGSSPNSSSETTKPQEACRGGSCTRPNSGKTEMAETLTDYWARQLGSLNNDKSANNEDDWVEEIMRIPPSYVDLGKEDFEV